MSCSSVSSVPPSTTFSSWKPRQMQNSGMPRFSTFSISFSVVASRAWS